MRPNMLLSALLIAALPGLAIAAAQEKDTESTKRIDKRQKSQEQRIEKGVKSGDITRKEAKRLEKGQARIDAAEKKAVADGKVTAEERARIEKRQDQQARDIRKQRTDEQERRAAAGKASASTGSSKATTAATAAASGKLGTLSTAQQDAFIKGEEQKAAADGYVTREEQARLDGYYKQVQNPWRFDQYRNRDRTRE